MPVNCDNIPSRFRSGFVLVIEAVPDVVELSCIIYYTNT